MEERQTGQHQVIPESNVCNVSATVDNGSASAMKRFGGGIQLVMITPLPPGYQPTSSGINCPGGPIVQPPRSMKSGVSIVPTTTAVSVSQPVPITVPQRLPGQHKVAGCMLEEVFLKAACKGKKDVQMFTVWNVNPSIVTSSDDLKDLIKDSLEDDITSGGFDVGYMLGSNVIRICSKEVVKEMWRDLINQTVA